MSSKKTVLRSNKAQISYWCKYMYNHPEFAAGEYSTARGSQQQAQQWAQLKDALDELGPSRSIEQWKVCWRDQKRKARVEGGAYRKATEATGNAVEVPELSENATLIIDTIGQEMAWGCGLPESPIGSSGASTSSAPVVWVAVEPSPLPTPPGLSPAPPALPSAPPALPSAPPALYHDNLYFIMELALNIYLLI